MLLEVPVAQVPGRELRVRLLEVLDLLEEEVALLGHQVHLPGDLRLHLQELRLDNLNIGSELDKLLLAFAVAAVLALTKGHDLGTVLLVKDLVEDVSYLFRGGCLEMCDSWIL